MSVSKLIAALGIPDGARVDRRVPKKLLLEHGAPTTADKRLIQEGIEEAIWVAALKPANLGVPEYRDETREYLEIAVLAVTLRPEAKAPRLTELIHRAIPYPLALAAAQGGDSALSLAHKRASQSEAVRVVTDAVIATHPFRPDAPSEAESAFLASLPLAAQSAQSLFALYGDWIGRIEALAAAAITGVFAPPESPDQAAARRAALDDHARLRREIAALRARAAKERQMNRRVELNLELQRLEAQCAQLAAQLRPAGAA